MNVHPLHLRIPYRQYVKPARSRTLRPAWFCDEMAVGITEVASEDAPIAYRVRSVTPLDPASDFAYDIRAFEGRLWWPTCSGTRTVRRVEFVESASGASPLALVAVDASIKLRLVEPFRTDRIDRNRVREFGTSEWSEREVAAHRGAQKILYCGDEILVDAGDPVIYAVGEDGNLRLTVGTSAWDRLTEASVIPGPSYHQALRSAVDGRVFGIDELDDRLGDLRREGIGVRSQFEIEIVEPMHRPASAPNLCARALAEAFSDHVRKAFRRQVSRETVPSLFDASGKIRASCEEVDMHAFLFEMSQIDDVVLLGLRPHELLGFRETLVRLASGIDGTLDPDEDAALDDFGN